MKRHFERVIFLIETDNLSIHEIAPPRITKKTHNPQKIGHHKYKLFYRNQFLAK